MINYINVTYQGNAEIDFLEDTSFEIVKCSRCDLIFQPNVLNENKLTELYNKWINPNLALKWNRKKCIEQTILFSRLLFFAKYYLDKDSSEINVLDYGAGFGQFSILANIMGFKSFALDSSQERIKFLKSNNINTVSVQDIESYSFDFIVLNQVLEHLTDPASVLKKIHSILDDKGIAYLSVPNCANIKSRIIKSSYIDNPEELHSFFLKMSVSAFQHINYFNNSNLKRLIKDCGFRIFFKPFIEIYCSTLTRSIYKPLIRPFYNFLFGTSFFFKKR